MTPPETACISPNSGAENVPDKEPDVVLTIPDAARLLCVSERTIYRMLKSGKLKCVRQRGENEKNRTCVKGNVLNKESQSGTYSAFAVSKLSDKRLPDHRAEFDSESFVSRKQAAEIAPKSPYSNPDSDPVLSRMRAELNTKDAQISELIAAQRELTQTVQKLQEQLYELARLVLLQKAEPVAPDAATGQTASETKQARSLVSRWLNRKPAKK